MERLTEHTPGGVVLRADTVADMQAAAGAALDKLAAYEDTGFTPEEFHAYWVFFEDLIGNQKASEALDWFRQILNAEQAGWLVVLPDGGDTAALAATIDSTDMIRVWCGGDSDLLIGLLSMLARDVAQRAGIQYSDLLEAMSICPPVGTSSIIKIEEGKSDEKG